jgi:hypothetical protein
MSNPKTKTNILVFSTYEERQNQFVSLALKSKTLGTDVVYFKDKFDLKELPSGTLIHGIVMLYYPSLEGTGEQVSVTLGKLDNMNFVGPIVVFPIKTDPSERLSPLGLASRFYSLRLDIQKPMSYEKLGVEKVGCCLRVVFRICS